MATTEPAVVGKKNDARTYGTNTCSHPHVTVSDKELLGMAMITTSHSCFTMVTHVRACLV